ncbi:hypothetical protein Cni_G05283 [Canna indica]|uniref:Uncharacterized protein n=1 Tax=Canna indica TaxID=4628 RepID=A0AAQ3JUW5_9LILI|nr:hypothetical protein Cni_G05283 [Canna indica]
MMSCRTSTTNPPFAACRQPAYSSPSIPCSIFHFPVQVTVRHCTLPPSLQASSRPHSSPNPLLLSLSKKGTAVAPPSLIPFKDLALLFSLPIPP